VLLKDDFAMTRALRAAFTEAGFEPHRRAKRPVGLAGGDGIGRHGRRAAARAFIHRLAIGHLDAVKLVDPELPWQPAHVWRGSYLSHAARAWLDVCHDVLGSAPAARGWRCPR
jgi:hypothetical protein